MKYYELKLLFPATAGEYDIEICVAELGGIGFESFTDEGNELLGYINEDEYKQFSSQIAEYIQSLEVVEVKCELTVVEEQNWNELWESNFDPIYIGDRCCIRASFHAKSECEYEIEIVPKMSFGTGHHATTYLMVEKILDSDFTSKRGLDMGAGTGILGIAAIMRGAENILAIDIDEWAEVNCRENVVMNNVAEKVEVILGDASSIGNNTFDFVLANINRNILLRDMQEYVSHLNKGGEILFSGFLEPDVEDIVEKAEQLGLKHVETRFKDGWQMVHVKMVSEN